MSRLTGLLNRIRAESAWSWLTPAQQEAGENLKNRLRVHGTVNLWGPAGSGKTFLAWLWVKEWQRIGYGRAVHFPFASEVQPEEGASLALVDNLSSRRESLREAALRCEMCGYRKIVLVTMHPAQDQLTTVPLPWRPEEASMVSERLRKLGFPPRSEEPFSFWDLVVPKAP